MDKKILVIEDNPEMRENIAELLELAGYHVTQAANGVEGLSQLREQQPNLVLCDIMMPQLDGFGVLRAMENFPHLAGTPFVFLTALAEKDDFRKGMDLGADDYLPKPFKGDELLRVVGARLRKKRLEKNAMEDRMNGLSDFMHNAKKVLGRDLIEKKYTKKKIRKKDVIFMEGDSSSHLYFLFSGKVKTYRTNEEGKEYITGIHEEGDFFGYFALTDDSSRRETAKAIEDAEVALLSRQDFLQLLATNRALSMEFISFVTKSLDEAEQRLLRLAYNSVRKRVAEALLFVCRKYKASDGDLIPLSRDILSTLAGISPESASRNLSDFREEGLIETYHGAIRVHSINKLERVKH